MAARCGEQASIYQDNPDYNLAGLWFVAAEAKRNAALSLL